MLKMAISAGTGRQSLAAWLKYLHSSQPVDFVLVREPGVPAGELVEACREAKQGAPAGCRVLVAGGRVDVALAAGLAGVHLSARAGELRPPEVRRLFPAAEVTVSCHTLEQVRQARAGGASAVLFAPVFAKVVDGVEVLPGVGLEGLGQACAVAGAMPVLALGGVTTANAAACVAAGATGVAGIRLFGASGAGAGSGRHPRQVRE